MPSSSPKGPPALRHGQGTRALDMSPAELCRGSGSNADRVPSPSSRPEPASPGAEADSEDASAILRKWAHKLEVSQPSKPRDAKEGEPLRRGDQRARRLSRACSPQTWAGASHHRSLFLERSLWPTQVLSPMLQMGRSISLLTLSVKALANDMACVASVHTARFPSDLSRTHPTTSQT